MSTPEQADALREEGNRLYKDGKLVEAIRKYREAAKLAPGDSAPVRNLSAAFYEIGHYKESVVKAQEALSAIHGAGTDGEGMLRQVQTLESRIKKAEAYLFQVSNDDKLQRRRQILQRLPRYRPNMLPQREYYNVGHDEATSLFDTSIELQDPEAKRVSFLFGGVGDSRNMLATISDLVEHEKGQKIHQKLYHFTLNDINNYAVSRDLVIWMLLQDLSEMDSKTDEAVHTLNTLVFVYFATMMPKYAFRQLHKTIDKAISALSAGRQPLKWVHLYKDHIPMYLWALKMWKGRALEVFTSSQVIDKVTTHMRAQRESNPYFFELTPAACKKEKLLYTYAAALYPSRRALELFDPEMQDLLDKFSTRPKANAEKFKNHLRQQWHVNTTLISPDFYDSLTHKEDYDLFHDPFQETHHFHPVSSPEGLPNVVTEMQQSESGMQFYDFVAPFFIKAANAIKSFESRLQVEVILGDIVDVCEKLRFGLYLKEDGIEMNAAVGTHNEVRPGGFPNNFDRIHLSNVPDYIGGHLSTFLYILPVLKKKLSSVAMSCCLRNTDQWESMDDFIAEYQCITDDDMLDKLTSVKILYKGDLPYPCKDYTLYAPARRAWRLRFADLLSRKLFNRWFYALFFKLALPFDCDIRQFTRIVFSPLNLTILFPLLCQLRLLGYPSHWLLEALSNILEDKVITSARPPWKRPMKASDVKRNHSEQKLTTAPFRRELATLTQLFQPLLPFSLPSTAIPSLSTIYTYTFKLPSYDDFSPQSTSLLLVFYNPALYPPDSPSPSFLDHLSSRRTASL